MVKLRKKISITLNFFIGAFAMLGVFLSCFYAPRDGYNPWYKRLLYFTQQSNIWIGVTCLVIAILSVIGIVKKKNMVKDFWYVLKFIFTISITITGIIFCSLLAPFAQFDIWNAASLLTHVVVPIFSILDFFVNEDIKLKKNQVWLSIIPPLCYFIYTSVLCILKVDFGRGDAFPYFFMDYHSEMGFFGFKDGIPYLGPFYWIVIILLLILLLSWVYYAIHPQTRKERKKLKNMLKNGKNSN